MLRHMTTVQIGDELRQLVPFVESSELLGDAGALRARASDDGYVFFRGLVDPDAIKRTRRDITAACLGTPMDFPLHRYNFPITLARVVGRYTAGQW